MTNLSKAWSVGNKPLERISVLDFGAKGDGNPDDFDGTDDTAAIMAAIDSVKGTTGTASGGNLFGVGSIIYFPPGIYLFDQIILDYVDRNHNIIFQGDGPGATILKTTNVTGGDMIQVLGNAAGGDSLHGFFMRDMSLEGNFQCGIGIRYERAIRQCGLERVAIHNTGSHGIEINSVSNMFMIQNCRIYRDKNDSNFETLAGSGIRATFQGEQVWMYANSIRGYEKGVAIGQNINICNIYGGDIHGNQVGIRMAGGTSSDGRVSGVEVRGVYFEQNGIDIDLNGTAAGEETQSIVIGGNSFSKATGLLGTYAQGTDLITSPTTRASLTIRRAKNITIEPNEFRKIGTDANSDVDHAIHVSSNANGVEIRKQNYQTGASTDNIVNGALISIDSSALNVNGFIDPDTDDNWDQQLRPVTIQQLALGLRVDQEIDAGKLDMVNGNIIHMEAEGGSPDSLSYIEIPNETGRLIILKPKISEPTITVNDNQGSPPAGYADIQIGSQFAMDPNDTLTIYYDSDDDKWYELSRSSN